MKTFVLLISSLFISASTFSQVLLHDYNDSSMNISGTIVLNPDTTGKHTVVFPFPAVELGIESAELVMNKKEISQFFEALSHAKAKYIEWCAAAKENDLQAFSKPILTDQVFSSGFFQSSSSWHFDLSVEVFFQFKIYKGKCSIHIFSQQLVSDSEPSVSCSSFDIELDNLESIDAFLKAISSSNIDSKNLEYAKKLRLFKQ